MAARRFVGSLMRSNGQHIAMNKEERRTSCPWSFLMPLVLLVMVFSQRAWSADGPSEYQIKAAFLFSFAHFVVWPSVPPSTTNTAPILIGVLGEDPFGASLDETVRNEEIQGRKINIVRSRHFDDLSNCQILYISKSEADHLATIISDLQNKPILSISDMEGFAVNGGIIRLYVIGKKVRFEINQAAAINHQLKLDAQLLSLGKVIESKPAQSAP
jgi:hypothetical protein